MKKNYRAGATGALLDEYERAISDLKSVIADIPDAALKAQVESQLGPNQ